MKDKDNSTFVLLGYTKYFYDRYCKNCKHDENKDTDPICKYLNDMLTGKKAPDTCEGRKGK